VAAGWLDGQDAVESAVDFAGDGKAEGCGGSVGGCDADGGGELRGADSEHLAGVEDARSGFSGDEDWRGCGGDAEFCGVEEGEDADVDGLGEGGEG